MFIYCKVLLKTPRKLLFTPCLPQDSNIILLITNAKRCQNSVYNLWYGLLVSKTYFSLLKGFIEQLCTQSSGSTGRKTRCRSRQLPPRTSNWWVMGSLTALSTPCSSVSTGKLVIKNVTVIGWGTIHDHTGPLSITVVLVIYLAHVL